MHFQCSQLSKPLRPTKGGEGVKNWEICVRTKILNTHFYQYLPLLIFITSQFSNICYIKFLSFGNICKLFWTDRNSFFYILQVQPQTRPPQKRSSMVMPPNFLMLWLQELCADKRRPFWYLILAKFLDGDITEMDSWAPEMLSIN